MKGAAQTPTRLGAFELEDKIGSGSMSDVYRGRHVDTQVPVAIKILSVDRSPHGKVDFTVAAEARAAAALRHPNIITLLDHGRVPEVAGHALDVGSPYLVMELASGGRLAERPRPSDWPQLRGTLVTLLDALAHAHARDVVHRDLSLHNVLLATATDLNPGLKLADFGIAFAATAAQPVDASPLLGTPAFMAPEQLDGRARDLGPWTDLYALGVIAHWLACGVTPWPTGGRWKVLHARVNDERGPFAPEIEVPDGFEDWVGRMLCWRHRERFQFAADAAHALVELDETQPLLAAETWGTTLTGGLMEGSEAVTRAEGRAFMSGPPVPRDWRRPHVDGPSIRLHGAGLGLYSVRSVPFVDRDEERARLWSGLLEVRQTGEARVFAIEGVPGAGKSCLAQWLIERAHELGAATSMTALHGRQPALTHGLTPMLSRFFRCTQTSERECLRRVHDELEIHGAASAEQTSALASLVMEGDGRPGAVRFSQPAERYEVLRKFLVRLGRTRPVILVIEDAQWGSEALGFVEHVLSHRARTPVVFLVTAVSAALAERPAELKAWTRITDHPMAARLRVAPLGEEHHRMLVRRLLPLEPDLSERIARRTLGNAMFAVQLIGEYVRRDRLVATPEGFGLRPGDPDDLPMDVEQLHVRRIEAMVDGQPLRVVIALEIAAALGPDVDREQWSRVVRSHPDPVNNLLGLEQALASASLIASTELGFRFAQEPIRRIIEDTAKRTGRWAGHHARIARDLQEITSTPSAPHEERMFRHAQEMGDLDAAFEHLFRAAHLHWSASALSRALADLDGCELLMRTSGEPTTDPRWTRIWRLEGEVRLQLGDIPGVDALADRMVDSDDNAQGPRLADGLFLRGQSSAVRGAFEEGRRSFERAVELYTRLGQGVAAGRCHRELGYIAQQSGDIPEAQARLTEARRAFTEADEPLELAYTYARFGLVARQRGEPAESSQFFQQAADLFAAQGSRFGVAISLNGLGDAARLAERVDEAEGYFEQSIANMESIGAEAAMTVPRLNLALIALARGDYEAAHRRVEEAIPVAEAAGQGGALACAHLLALPHAATTSDWAQWDDRFSAAKTALEASGFVDPDVAWSAELAGDLAAQRGRSTRAEAAYRLALVSLQALGRAEWASTVGAKAEAASDGV